MNKYTKQWVVVNLDDIAVRGVFDTQEEAGQWIFDRAISRLWEPEDYQSFIDEGEEEWAWLDFDSNYVVRELSSK